jgi:Flp pilus assembly pilin Flp
MFQRLSRIWRDEEGVTTVEYALVLAVLVVAALTVWATFGGVLRGRVTAYSNAVNAIS